MSWERDPLTGAMQWHERKAPEVPKPITTAEANKREPKPVRSVPIMPYQGRVQSIVFDISTGERIR